MVKSFRRKNVHRVRRKSARNHPNAKELGMMGAVLGFSALQTNSGSEHEGTAGAGAGAGAGAQELMAGGQGGRGGRGGRGGKSLDASVFILTFMEILNTIKIFHWSTLSYPSHKATDELHSKMSELVDSFIEQYIGGVGGGKTPSFHVKGGHNIPFCECKSLEHFRTKLAEYKTFLVSLTERLDGVTELLNIRDEMIGEIDQAVYLLRLK
jgi:hypothetical protein